MAIDDNEQKNPNSSGSKKAEDQEKQERKERRKKRKRWGTAATNTGAAPAPPPAVAAAPPTAASSDPKARILAMQESIRARLAAAKAAQQQQTTETNNSGNSNKRPASDTAAAAAAAAPPPVKRAKVYELDLSVTAPTFEKSTTSATEAPSAATGAALAEKGKKRKTNKKKPPSNPYLAHLADDDDDDDDDQADNGDIDVVDERLQRTSKIRKRHKELKFVEPGTYQELAALKREKEQKAVASGYTSGRKTGHTITAASLADVYSAAGVEEGDDDDQILAPRADAHPDTQMPLVMDWWDVELLPSKLKKQVASVENKQLTQQSQAALNQLRNQRREGEEETEGGDDGDGNRMNESNTEDTADSVLSRIRQACWEQASLSYSKTASLVQHIVPVKHGQSDAPKAQPVLHLTKKELKRQRKLRRQKKQRELQDLQAAGLIPAPEPRLTLSNFMQVLGDQAVLDPSQMERKVAEQMEARKHAHEERNLQNKLTKEQRAAKLARKNAEDTSNGVAVAMFVVNDCSHPYHRAKVDLNAQQWNLTGCVLECSAAPSFAMVMVEGGPKAINKYTRLVQVRMKWTGPDDEDEDDMDNNNDEDDEEAQQHKFNKNNTCQAVWQGMAPNRNFHGFLFQQVETHDQARKVLKSKGLAQYWDQAKAQVQGTNTNSLFPKLKLVQGDDDDNDDDDEKDEVMEDAA